MHSERRIRVLLVEDNAGDDYLIREALMQEAQCEIVTMSSGSQAYAYLSDCASAEEFHLIVLDLNLPGRDGGELLDMIRSRPELRATAVAVLSSYPREVIARRIGQADCYVKKPVELEAYLAIGKELLACVGAV